MSAFSSLMLPPNGDELELLVGSLIYVHCKVTSGESLVLCLRLIYDVVLDIFMFIYMVCIDACTVLHCIVSGMSQSI